MSARTHSPNHRQGSRQLGRSAQAGFAVALALIVAIISATTPANARSTGDDAAEIEAGVDPIRIVLIVDESGSMSDEAVDQEKLAAELIATADLSDETEVAVLGFGSSSGSGQNAVTDYCNGFVQLASELDRERVISCVDGVHAREPDEGQGTDHNLALRAALELIGPPSDEIPAVVFLLTDGELSVGSSPAYGPDEGERDETAFELIRDEVLPTFADRRVQLWPLGFGDAQLASLEFYAGGSFVPAPCLGGTPITPEATVVTDVSEVASVLFRALAASRCQQVVAPAGEEVTALGLGESITKEIAIPAFATDVALVVSKGSPSVVIEFVDPDGITVEGEAGFDGQRFDRSAPERLVETLRIEDPKAGAWKVILSGADREVLVRTLAVWEGRVRSLVQISPVTPLPGDAIDVEVRVLTARGEPLDQEDVEDYRFLATVRIPDLGIDDEVLLQNDGIDPDRSAADVIYSGRYVLPPDCSGAVTVLGQVAGAGVTGDQRQSNFSCDRTTELLVTTDFRLPSTIRAGDRFDIVLTAINGGALFGATVELRGLDTSDGIRLVGDNTWEIGQGQSTFGAGDGDREPLRLVVSPDVAAGDLIDFELAVVDSGGELLLLRGLQTEVDAPPGWWERYRRLIVAGALALIAAALSLRWFGRRRRAAAAVREVAVETRHGRIRIDRYQAPRTAGSSFSVAIDRETGLLAKPTAGAETVLTVRRSGGGFTVQLAGVERRVTHGEAIELDDCEYVVVVIDLTAEPPRSDLVTAAPGPVDDWGDWD